jgi:hypothetical protein
VEKDEPMKGQGYKNLQHVFGNDVESRLEYMESVQPSLTQGFSGNEHGIQRTTSDE